MSMDITLTVKDYQNILNWYERAFAKQNNPNQDERNTFIKLSAMALAKADEAKEAGEDE
tara:strand:- start:34459 stop:34635 length:177 start_codon:yes stop_codon:yes gene_type:complete